jgi:LysM repeat protein
MNNPNPFLPEGSFLEQKNKARRRLNIVVYFSISLSVVVLMALLIQGCRKPSDGTETANSDTSSLPQLPTNPPPDMGMASNPPIATNVPETNIPVYNPPAPPVAPPAPPVAATEDYTVIKGDTYATIGKKTGVSSKAIADANPGVDPKKLKIGQKIHIPAPTSAPTAAPQSVSGTMDAGASGGMQTYKVKSGDTLTVIAKKFHVTIKAIQSANNLTTTSIKVGQALKIPGGSTPTSAPVPPSVESLPPPSLSAPTSAPAPTTMPR